MAVKCIVVFTIMIFKGATTTLCTYNQSPGVEDSPPEEQAMAEEEISGEEKTERHDSSKEDVSEDKPEQMEETAAQEQQETLDPGKGVNKGREHC